MPDNDVKKLVKEEVQKLRMEINEQMQKMQIFSEAYLLILLDLALMNDPCERLTRVLSAVSIDFPQPILEIYVKRSVSRAKEAKVEFEDFADCLTKGLGDRVKELRLADEITRVYGIRAGERWKNIIEGSNNPKKPDCACKASSK
jgi:hypothetical protein